MVVRGLVRKSVVDYPSERCLCHLSCTCSASWWLLVVAQHVARRFAFASSPLRFHLVCSCNSVYLVFLQTHCVALLIDLRNTWMCIRVHFVVFHWLHDYKFSCSRSKFLSALCTSRSEVLGQMHTRVKTTDVYVGGLVCRVCARRPRCRNSGRDANHREKNRQAGWSESVEIGCHNTRLDQSIHLYLKRCSRVLFESHLCRLLMPCAVSWRQRAIRDA